MGCHLSKKLRGECDTCGIVPPQLHMPEEVHGWYCAECCPVCRVSRRPVDVRPQQNEQALQAA